jgi:DNA-binding transcriptional LysR family regulator
MDPDLTLFVDVVAAGSLSAAGRKAGVSVSTVSKRIARLEDRLGVRLLNRTTRRLELTSRGELFHRDIVLVLDAAREAEARVTERTADPMGLLSVTAPTSFGRLLIAPYLHPFLDRYPRVQLDLNLSDEFDDLFGRGIDLAVRITPAVSPTLTARRMADSRRVLCAAPGYRLSHGLPASAEDLADHRILAAAGQLPWRLTGPRGAFMFDGLSHVRTNSSEVVRELALAGVGIALRSLWDVGHDLAAGRLERVLPNIQGSMDVGVYIVHPRGRTTAAAKALIQYLEQIWSPRPPWEVDESGQPPVSPSAWTP